MFPELGILRVFILAFIVIWAILWLFLPFAVFGIKDKLDELILETKKNTDAVNNSKVSLSDDLDRS